MPRKNNPKKDQKGHVATIFDDIFKHKCYGCAFAGRDFVCTTSDGECLKHVSTPSAKTNPKVKSKTNYKTKSKINSKSNSNYNYNSNPNSESHQESRAGQCTRSKVPSNAPRKPPTKTSRERVNAKVK